MSNNLCIINVGLYRTGSTTFANAWFACGKAVYREFPELIPSQHRDMLLNPQALIGKWWEEQGGRDTLLRLIHKYDILGDGWMPLLVFLPPDALADLVAHAPRKVRFVCTSREPVEDLVASELHHWVRHDLERHLDEEDDRIKLAEWIQKRARAHAHALSIVRQNLNVTELALAQVKEWHLLLQPVGLDEIDLEAFAVSLRAVGKQNANPELPIEGVLVTMRIEESDSVHGLFRLISSIEADPICKYLLVLALDEDEANTSKANELKTVLEERCHLGRMVSLHILTNPPKPKGKPFHICSVWDRMANVAWDHGAKWVVLLGDDVIIECPYHYRAIYQCFLHLHETLGFPLWFGCPWYHDKTFPGFPTFPVVGAIHRDIFHALIPQDRKASFVNQDLDPYLQRLYLQFGAAPYLKDVHLSNNQGGNNTNPTRYERKPAARWRDWVLEDTNHIEKYLRDTCAMSQVPSKILLDVTVPTYRINVSFLKRICSLQVPEYMRTTFIIIVDHPELLLKTTGMSTLGEACASLEKDLVESSKHTNNVRVRCNATNEGASSSRNRGIDESAAKYILFLDDDVIPEPNLLFEYGTCLDEWMNVQSDKSDDGYKVTSKPLHGLVGMVQFPRRPDMPLRYAAVLMSYLTFMFEIASNDLYQHPAWGVTANLLVARKSNVRFDTRYAKTGGGEDVDFCLRSGGRFRSVPTAVVHHDFWDGSVLAIARHFFLWAVGDSALFERFPEHCYRSFPNVVEFLCIAAIPLLCFQGWTGLLWMAFWCIVADCAVDMLDMNDFDHRCQLLEYKRPIQFYFAAHILANLYVIILECGRLKGHVQRGQWRNIARRFDWHCGRLARSRKNFRKKEMHKFVLFVTFFITIV